MRTVYNMFEAENQGAHIVTVPDSVLSRMNRIGDDTYEASVKLLNNFIKMELMEILNSYK